MKKDGSALIASLIQLIRGPVTGYRSKRTTVAAFLESREGFTIIKQESKLHKVKSSSFALSYISVIGLKNYQYMTDIFLLLYPCVLLFPEA